MSKRQDRRYLFFIVQLGCWAWLQACSTVPQKSIDNDALAKPLDFEYLKLSALMTYQNSQNSHGKAHISFRIQKDKMIWFSVRVGLIEALRGTITPANIILIDRIHRTYRTYTYAALQEMWGYTCSYAMLQTLLLGTFVYKEEALTRTDRGQIAIQQQNGPWQLHCCIDDTKRQQKKLVALDVLTQSRCVATYQNFQPYQQGIFFRQASIALYNLLNSQQPSLVLKLRRTKAQWPKQPLKFPVTIPAEYEKR